VAALYGRLQGNRGEATRTGSKASGIRTIAETWKSKVTVELEHDGSCVVYAASKFGSGQVKLWEGNSDEFFVAPSYS
jgi:hypothetical protein